MKIHKSKLSLAVGAVLSAAMLVPATAFGVRYDVDAYEVEHESGGDSLIFPIYTTVNGATTSFSITNKDDDGVHSDVPVLKIRFREQEHSMDVLDFIVVLSPQDKFDFWVSQPEGSERPVMSWNDNTCVVGPEGNSVEFPPPNTPFVTTNEQMQVGHLEVLGMGDIKGACMRSDGTFYEGPEDSGSCPENPSDVLIADWAIHDESGKPANCAGLIDILSDPQKTYMLRDGLDEDLEEELLGRYVITADAGGVEAGGDALELEDTDFELYAQSKSDCEAQYGCTSYYAWDKALWDHPHLGELDYLDGLQMITSSEEVAGDWSNNPANAVGTDWVLTFFSKYAYLDYIAKSDCNDSGSDRAWCLLYETLTDEGIAGVWTDQSTTDTCLNDNNLSVWNTEEAKAAGNVNVSPGQRETLDLCNEVNVFTLAAEDGAAPRDSLIQTNERRSVISFKNLDAVRGWASLELGCDGNEIGPMGYDLCPSLGGLIFTTRATDNPLFNNGSITEIKKTDAFCGGEAWYCVEPNG